MITPVDHNDTITNVAVVIQQVEHHKTTRTRTQRYARIRRSAAAAITAGMRSGRRGCAESPTRKSALAIPSGGEQQRQPADRVQGHHGHQRQLPDYGLVTVTTIALVQVVAVTRP